MANFDRERLETMGSRTCREGESFHADAAHPRIFRGRERVEQTVSDIIDFVPSFFVTDGPECEDTQLAASVRAPAPGDQRRRKHGPTPGDAQCLPFGLPGRV